MPVVPSTISDVLLAECIGKPQVYYDLGRLCDTVGGRNSGTPSGNAGEEWAFELMTQFGLEGVHYEELSVPVWTRGSLTVECISPACWALTALSHGNAPARADLTGAVIDAGHGELSDYERLADAVRDRIVLCDEGVQEGHRGLHRSEKLRLAAEHGAAGLMIYSSASGGVPRTGNCGRGEAPIPSVGISQEDGLRLLRLIQRSPDSPPQVRIAMTNSFSSGTARNVIGELRGSEIPESIVLAGGHLDSWDVAQGATDNGLGSAIVLEMARVLAALPKRPRRTVRFAIWAAEEVGLCGSYEYARVHAAELDSFTAVMNFDMTADPYGYWLPSLEMEAGVDGVGRSLLVDLCSQLAPLGMRNQFRTKAGLHSDHQAFMLEGVQVLALLAENNTQGAHYYHSVGDTFDKVSLPAMCRASAVGAHTMWALADIETAPFERLHRQGIRQLIEEAGLLDALKADGLLCVE